MTNLWKSHTLCENTVKSFFIPLSYWNVGSSSDISKVMAASVGIFETTMLPRRSRTNSCQVGPPESCSRVPAGHVKGPGRWASDQPSRTRNGTQFCVLPGNRPKWALFCSAETADPKGLLFIARASRLSGRAPGRGPEGMGHCSSCYGYIA